ncbi:MAG TPA: sugar ABC transporter permease [Firmicutes bacterium]|nr:sugar ABC transporter permease [Bacillota bacterium]
MKRRGEGVRRKRYQSLAARQNRHGFLFVFPWIIGFVLFFLIPLGQSIYYSFCQVTITEYGMMTDFVGLDNFYYAFRVASNYVDNLKESLINFVYMLPITVVLSLILAVILNQNFHGRLLARAVFFLPVIIAAGVVMDIFNSDVVAEQMREGGSGYIMNSIDFVEVLRKANLPSNIAQPLITYIEKIFNLIWQCGVQTILFLAGLQSVPVSLYEVSRVEGSSAWEDFWFITLPMLSHILLLVIIYTIIDIFTNADNPVMDQAYSFIQVQQNYDKSSAMLWAYFALVGIVITVLLVLLRRFLLKKWER